MEPKLLQREFSAAIGLVGGLIDIFVGSSILQAGMGQSMMMNRPSLVIGYFLLMLGVIVLLTDAYLLFSKMMKNRFTIGLLMIFYGVVMLILGVGMIRQLFGDMMQWSSSSGIIMILVGAAMLYSGSSMIKSSKEEKM